MKPSLPLNLQRASHHWHHLCGENNFDNGYSQGYSYENVNRFLIGRFQRKKSLIYVLCSDSDRLVYAKHSGALENFKPG